MLIRMIARLIRSIVDEIITQNEEAAHYPPGLGPEDTFQTIDGPVKLKDIPRTADGRFDAEWIESKCACETHMHERRLRGDG